MPAELLCPTHGPYDASYGSCPYCSGAFKRPPEPAPLSEDDMDTNLDIGARSGAAAFDDEAETDLGQGQRARGGFSLDEEITFIPSKEEDTKTQLFESETIKGPVGILWIKEGDRRGQTHKIKDGMFIGRKNADMILDDPHVSGIHAKINLENEQYVIWDCGSKTGTFVNGEKIRCATILNENDTIKIGNTVFGLKILA